jgi:parallel beta-helix repeat protein
MRYVFRIAACLIPFALALSSGAFAATKSLTCGGGKTIASELAKLLPGDVLQVSGVCTENVTITSSMSDITIQGVNGATVQATAPTQTVFSVRGRGIRISNLTITGGFEGIQVLDGGFAWIEGNTVTGNTEWGIQVSGTSVARIWNNVIQNNFGGVLVNSGSFALIGASSVTDAAVSPNTIKNNTGDAGIQVTRSSAARVVANTITGNAGEGVHVLRGSQADVASNTIEGNGLAGVQASNNSTIGLGQSSGTSPFALPNSTSGVLNGGVGVACFGGGYVNGRQGTLNGTGGAANIAGCAGSLAP